MNHEHANLRRDRRLRRLLLLSAHGSRIAPLGGISARRLMDVVESSVQGDQGIESDDHALTLLIDLRDGGYVTLDDTRRRKTERYGIDTIFVKATDQGSRLIREEIPVDPSIEDERI